MSEVRIMDGSANICVLGSINMDLVIQAPRFARPGETVLGGVYESFPGGKGANQAIAAQRAGAQASLIGCVGDDAFGRDLLECIAAAGVDMGGVETRSDCATGVGVITIDKQDGENMIVVASGANMRVTGDQVERSRRRIEQADVLLMQLEVPMDANVIAAGIAKRARTSVMLNAAPAMSIPDELLKATDVLIVNRAEASMLSGLEVTTDPREFLDRLGGLGIERIVVTLGEKGLVSSDHGDVHAVRAPEVKAIDTVGAGDAFTGVLAAALAGGTGWEEALIRASAAGGISVSRQGAIPSLPHGEEIAAMADSLHALRLL